MLTENLILQKTKQNDLRHVKKLNVCGIDLVDIDILRDAPNLEVCSLSVNKVRSLEPLSHCTRLQELYLRKNDVEDIVEVAHLSNLRHLRYLWLAENPCSAARDYRSFVIRACPQLVKLDDQVITDEERMKAQHSHGIAVPNPVAEVPSGPPHYMSPRRGSAPTQSHRHHHDPVERATSRGAVKENRPPPHPSLTIDGEGPNAYNGDDVPVGGGRMSRAIVPPTSQSLNAERWRDEKREEAPRRTMGHSPPPPSLQEIRTASRTSPARRTANASPPSDSPKAAPRYATGGAALSVGAPSFPGGGTVKEAAGGLRGEEGVFRAVLLLLNELSPAALQQVKCFIDEKQQTGRKR